MGSWTMFLMCLSVWMLWCICGTVFGAYLLDMKSASSIKELSSSKLKIGLILIMSGPAFILGVLAIRIEDKVSLFVGRFIDWLVD